MTLSSPSDAGQWGYIDKAGLWLVHPMFTYADRFSEGLACVTEADDNGSQLSGYIDGSGGWAIEPRYSWASRFSQGLAVAMPSNGPGLCGYIDHKGDWAIQPSFVGAGDFMPEGLAMVWLLSATTPTPASAPRTTDVVGGLGPMVPAESQPISAYIDKTGKIVWESETPTDSTGTGSYAAPYGVYGLGAAGGPPRPWFIGPVTTVPLD